jgi:hsp70-interacting protein
MADQAMLKSILNWSLKQQDGTTSDDVKPMSEDRKKWLAEALDSIVMNETKRIQDIVRILEYSTSSSSSSKVKEEDDDELLSKTLEKASKLELVKMRENGLDELIDRLCQIDNAKYFSLNHGGKGKLPLLMEYMKHEHASLRWRAADVFATVVQNNPEPQARAIELGILNFIMNQFKSEKDIKVQTKLFYALSSVLRGDKVNLSAFKSFTNAGGFTMLKSLISKKTTVDNKKLCKKAMFFSLWIFNVMPALRKEFADPNLVRSILTHANQSEDVDLSEKSLQVLLELVKGVKDDMKKMDFMVPAVDKIIATFRDQKTKDKEDEMYITERLRVAVSIAVGLRKG